MTERPTNIRVLYLNDGLAKVLFTVITLKNLQNLLSKT